MSLQLFEASVIGLPSTGLAEDNQTLVGTIFKKENLLARMSNSNKKESFSVKGHEMSLKSVFSESSTFSKTIFNFLIRFPVILLLD